LIDFEQMSPQELILNYLIEVRGQGFFFSYSDLRLIDQWLQLCPDADELLVLIADIAPAYFEKSMQTKGSGRNLKRMHKMILKKIKDRGLLGMGSGTLAVGDALMDETGGSSYGSK
jgi:hypothetical protein